MPMNKTELLQVRMTPKLKSQLQALAAAQDETVSNFVLTLIKNEIKKAEG